MFYRSNELETTNSCAHMFSCRNACRALSKSNEFNRLQLSPRQKFAEICPRTANSGLIARFITPAEAVRIAKVFLLGDRAEGQLPFAKARPSARHEDRIIADAQAWIADNYRIDQPVATMVVRSGLAERTFKRRFRIATGYTVIDYVQTLRIEEAKQLLETTNTATSEIAAAVGYQDTAFFRRLFKRQAGVTPSRYRKRFANIGHIATSLASAG